MSNFNIDLYCERLDESYWAEPINAVTNLAFIVASLIALYIHNKSGLKNSPFIFLSLLVFCIGTGSFLFHTHADHYSELADTIPIWSFVVIYLYYVNRIVFQVPLFQTMKNMAMVLALAYIGLILSQTSNDHNEPFFNGSLQYAPALFFLVVFTWFLYQKDKSLYKYALYASFTFCISLFFRTIDLLVCDFFTVGTHFIWHICNGLMLFFLLYIMHLSIKKQSTHETL